MDFKNPPKKTEKEAIADLDSILEKASKGVFKTELGFAMVNYHISYSLSSFENDSLRAVYVGRLRAAGFNPESDYVEQQSKIAVAEAEDEADAGKL